MNWSSLKSFVSDQRAAKVSELAIVLALIVAGSIALLVSIGPKIVTMYQLTDGGLP